jgi:hypothetical protein
MTEPVAYINVEERKLEWATPIGWNTPTVVKMDKVPLYAAPPKKEWVGLTDEEIEGAIDEDFAFGLDNGNLSNEYVIRYARAIEFMLKEKNNG